MTKKSDVLQAVEVGEDIFFLRSEYQEGDASSEVGHVFSLKDMRDVGAPTTQVLGSNEPLHTMWASPAGCLWVASANGSVATTAPVTWPAPTSGADYLTLAGPRWTATDLPRLASGLPPNVTALWGNSDEDVYAGTYGGHVYRWDGLAWRQVFEGPGKGVGTLRAFGGAPGDVYALGEDGTALHFDGGAWRRLALPGPANGHELLSGLHRLPGGDVLIAAAGSEGRLLRGSAQRGFTEVGRYPISLIDMAPLGDRILFATGNGVAELLGTDVRMIRETFKAVAILPGAGRVFLIASDRPNPTLIEYDPRQPDQPWWAKWWTLQP